MSHIRLDAVSLRYPIYNVSARSLKLSVFKQLAGSDVMSAEGGVWVQALDAVTFTANEGDRIGLVGRNGSGKSTLLRVLAGISFPQFGTCDIDGRVVPLLERGLGVNPELTGAQNIALPMRLLGATTEDIRAATDDIAEWSELGPFFNLPVRTYSEGMRARLMFAICTACRGDILIMDEWLSAGDHAFAERAHQRMHDVLDRSGIVVIASHSVDLMRSVCNRIIWMQQGRIMMDGPVEDTLAAYLGAGQDDTPAADDTPTPLAPEQSEDETPPAPRPIADAVA